MNKTKTSSKQAKTQELSFENATKRLEQIQEALESEHVPLEKAMLLFEEGIKISKWCENKLNCFEKKIQLVKEGKDEAEDQKEDEKKKTNNLNSKKKMKGKNQNSHQTFINFDPKD